MNKMIELSIKTPMESIKWDSDNKKGIITLSNISFEDFSVLATKIDKLLDRKLRRLNNDS